MADIYGVFSRCFVDCGSQTFTIFDKDGEQLKEIFIHHISSVRILSIQRKYFVFFSIEFRKELSQ
jgi:hypothetical protein